MKAAFGFFLLILLLAVVSGAQAATVSSSITVTPTSATGPVTPVVTWTSQGAATCSATGGWSGAKAAQGTETLPQTTKTTTYGISCTSPTGPATLAWTPPTTNLDGSAVNVTGYTVFFGSDPANLARGSLLPASSASATIQVPPGKTYFALATEGLIAGQSVESMLSAVVSKTVVADSSTSTITLNVAVVPNPPTNVTVN